LTWYKYISVGVILFINNPLSRLCYLCYKPAIMILASFYFIFIYIILILIHKYGIECKITVWWHCILLSDIRISKDQIMMDSKTYNSWNMQKEKSYFWSPIYRIYSYSLQLTTIIISFMKDSKLIKVLDIPIPKYTIRVFLYVLSEEKKHTYLKSRRLNLYLFTKARYFKNRQIQEINELQ
jgi:hypothetical protein